MNPDISHTQRGIPDSCQELVPVGTKVFGTHDGSIVFLSEPDQLSLQDGMGVVSKISNLSSDPPCWCIYTGCTYYCTESFLSLPSDPWYVTTTHSKGPLVFPHPYFPTPYCRARTDVSGSTLSPTHFLSRTLIPFTSLSANVGSRAGG